RCRRVTPRESRNVMSSSRTSLQDGSRTGCSQPSTRRTSLLRRLDARTFVRNRVADRVIYLVGVMPEKESAARSEPTDQQWDSPDVRRKVVGGDSEHRTYALNQALCSLESVGFESLDIQLDQRRSRPMCEIVVETDDVDSLATSFVS